MKKCSEERGLSIERSIRVRVACALRDPSALARVATCITRLGGQALALSRAAILSATLSAGIDALVFDLEPGDLSARDFVRTVHAARPDWPVWLYYGLRILIIERLAEVASLPRVWATPQLAHPAREAEIRVHVQSLVTSVPRFRLLRVLDPLLRTRPGEVRQFLETTFESAEQGGWSRGWSRDVVGRSPSELRHLERVCLAAGVSGPQILLDRARLVFLTFKSFAFNMSLGDCAERAGLSRRAFHSLRQRVLGANARRAGLGSEAEFDFAVTAFVEACNLPGWTRRNMVERVIRDCSA